MPTPLATYSTNDGSPHTYYHQIFEFRAPDASGNPYLAFAAQLMAGLDGIKNKIEPHEPVDKDLYELPPEEAKNIPQVPASLAEALDALEADNEFLTAGRAMGLADQDFAAIFQVLAKMSGVQP